MRSLHCFLHSAVFRTLLVPSIPSYAQDTAAPGSAATPASVDAAKREKIEQLFTAMHLQQTYVQMMNQILQQNEGMVKSLFPNLEQSAEQKQEYDAFMLRVNETVRSAFSWQVLEPEYIKIYAANYSTEELNDLNVFYQSRTGQAMVDKTPEILRQSSAAAVEQMGVVAPKLRAMMEEEMKKIQALPRKPGS